jgi:acyl-CoA thioester hydrolase
MNPHLPHPDDAALPSLALQVLPDWIDLYGHMNAAHYVFVFDRHGYELFERYGIGRAYTEAENRGLYTAEIHTVYRRELLVGTPLSLRLRFLESNAERLMCLLELFNASTGRLAATMEQLSVHVDLATRKTTPFAPALGQALAAAVASHARHPLPDNFERRLRLTRPR